MKCSWCQEDAVGEVEIEPPRYGKDKRTGVKVEKKPAKTAPACADHLTIVENQPPFYTCGCFYIEGEFKCPRHRSILREPWLSKFSKATIKHSPVVKKGTSGFVVK
jgi:hypothetical protein